ncbi:MAG: hypothetical protein A4E53_01614 [Pelotomaculum sp. PtaB.Bin104]|nr:MAG: hypothetical protein A4E53_01614 [Pelotomaculum sp. PtaB.Bin104]
MPNSFVEYFLIYRMHSSGSPRCLFYTPDLVNLLLQLETSMTTKLLITNPGKHRQ